jgi:hypothetical protein
MAPDPEGKHEYTKMMTWVAVALAASVIAALVIVEIVIRRYGS